MAEFLISRAEGSPASTIPVDELGVPMLFQMWSTRQDPYQTLADGDTLWWVDQRTPARHGGSSGSRTCAGLAMALLPPGSSGCDDGLVCCLRT